MSVVGSLEDLSFPDVLQIIHASRRTGTLILTMRDGERRVRFENGLIRGATLGRGGPELEDLLVSRGLVAPSALEEARARAAADAGTAARALVRGGAIAQEAIERLVREEISSGLRSVVLGQEGEFRFELERDREPEERVLLLVERSVLRRALERALGESGVEVETCASAAQALERARALGRGGGTLSYVGDLILPESGGEGWQGGLDLVRRIRALNPAARGIVLGEVGAASAGPEARAAGAAGYLAIPDLGGARLGDIGRLLSEFGARVRDAVIDRDRGSGPDPAAEPVRVVDQLSLLRGLVGEMHAEREVEIPLLVLRLATEYFERGVLFVVRDNEAHGTGAFGGAPEEGVDGGLDGRVRGVALPLLRGSILETAVRTRAPYVGPISPSRANAPLIEKIGAPLPQEAAILPVAAGADVFALLYGDNGGSARPLGDVRGLEIFVAQAGIALQNAALQRRLMALSPGAGTSAPHV